MLSDRSSRKRAARDRIEAKEAERLLRRSLLKAIGTPTECLSQTQRELLESNHDAAHKIRKSQDDRKRKSSDTVDSPELLEERALELATMIQQSHHTVIFTGAGISTAANIPDYRGSNGAYARMNRGEEVDSIAVDICKAEPTFTHRAIESLARKAFIKHVVSQNCDGLHLRSGLPRHQVSEIHGNSMIEYCPSCLKEYFRSFDVTNLSRFRFHKTARTCYCGNALHDTIVHFGEKGAAHRTVNWDGALQNVAECDLIICLGSSLKVLKKYPLWRQDQPKEKRPKVVIVNLQWTPKDRIAALKIHGSVDEVLMLVTKHLQVEVPIYDRARDPFLLAAQPVADTSNDDTGNVPSASSGWYGRGLQAVRKKGKRKR